jgi:hypothetical protein
MVPPSSTVTTTVCHITYRPPSPGRWRRRGGRASGDHGANRAGAVTLAVGSHPATTGLPTVAIERRAQPSYRSSCHLRAVGNKHTIAAIDQAQSQAGTSPNWSQDGGTRP